MKDGDEIKVVSIKDIGTHTDYDGKYNYYGGTLFGNITFDVGKHFLIYVVEREDVRFDGQKFYFELSSFDNKCHYATIYDIDLLNEHFQSAGDYREEQINSILND